MTISESLAFLQEFLSLAGDAMVRVEVVLCPPATAVHPLRRALEQVPPQWKISIGAQDISAEGDFARTGQVSASLLAEAGCRWAMLGHWEVRRQLGADDAAINRKVKRALEAGMNPLIMVGPGSEESLPLDVILEKRLSRILDGCSEEQVSQAAFVYEPEASIGKAAPIDPDQAGGGCRLIRERLGWIYGDRIAAGVRILYGGSVMPESAPALLALPEIDGLGASRQGRDPAAFARILHMIDQIKRPQLDPH